MQVPGRDTARKTGNPTPSVGEDARPARPAGGRKGRAPLDGRAVSDATLRPAAESRESATDARNRQRRGTRQLLLARMGFMVSGYLVVMILARELGPADYGVYGFVVSAVVWLQMVVTAGIPAATSKLIPERLEQGTAVETTARALLVGTSLVLFVAGWFAAPTIARVFDIEGGTWLFRLAICELPFAAMYAGYQGILSGHRRFGSLALAHVLYALVKILGIGLLLAIGVSLAGAFVLNVASTAAVFLYLFVRFPVREWRPDRRMLRPLLQVAVPMGVYLVSQQVLLSIDLWSLKGMWSGADDVIGYYVASLTLARTLLVVPGVQSGVVFTLTAWALARDDETQATAHLTEATRFVLLVIGPPAVFLGLEAAPVLSLLFSAPYAAGAAFLVLHLIGFGLFGLLDTFLHCLMASGRQRTSAGILVGLLPFVILANVILIPAIGPRGAAISLASGILAGTAIAGVLAYRRFGRLVRLRTLVRVVVAVGTVSLAAHWIPAPGAWVLLKLVGLEGACLGLLVLMGEVSKDDLVLPSVGADGGRAP